MAVFIRILIFFSIIVLTYMIFKYLFHPKRKLELAHDKKELYLLDDFKQVRKNLLVTQKGVLFEGEKYLGTADEAFRVVHIKLWTKSRNDLHGLRTADFEEIENLLFKHYPYASIEWSGPVKELLKGNK
ncbi:sigma-w pathway protein ysdB [Bacillus horti]|uniref:Sigma-w pathway protein ysdB n=1 Tax=Caldalkalibacillus horti TaxID=77523 RepID=A0ABT9VWL1_9BACI|nr:sigma-w pathway protein ysdB [Bacillus horti]MDQ0165383.1 hypothetical protein [Bacillus horti]